MEFNKIINSNYFLIKKISQPNSYQRLASTLKYSTFKPLSNNTLTYKLLTQSHTQIYINSLHTLPSYKTSCKSQENFNFFPTSILSLSSQLGEVFSNSLSNYTPYHRKEYFRISSLYSKDEENSSEKVVHKSITTTNNTPTSITKIDSQHHHDHRHHNEVLAPPLTEEQIAKHEKEKQIYQKIRKFEHYNYFRSISKPSYYDTLKIDDDDKNLSLIDRFYHRYFSKRKICTKYNSRNLNRGFVYIRPEKEAEQTTTICDCSTDKSPRELMVLLGWWNCHPKHLKKYVKLYSSIGHPVLAYISPTLLLIVPKILNIKNEHLMKQLFKFWREKRDKGEEYKIMFHTFSDNGSYVFAHFTYVLQVNLRKYRRKMKAKEKQLLERLNLTSLTITPSLSSMTYKISLANHPLNRNSNFNSIEHNNSNSSNSNNDSTTTVDNNNTNDYNHHEDSKYDQMTEDEFLVLLEDKEKDGHWKRGDRTYKLVQSYRQAKKDYDDYEKFFYCMEAVIMDSGPSLLTQSVITRGITAGITSMKCMRYFGIKHTNYSPKLSKMICYFYYIYVRQPSIAKYLLDIYYPAFYNVPKHMAYMFMYGNGDRVICPDLIEPYIYNLQKNGFLIRRAYFEGSDHVMHFVVHREVYKSEVLKFIHDIREHSKIQSKSGVRVIYDEKTGIIQDHEKILIPDKSKSDIKSIWARAKKDEEHFRFLGIIPKRSKPVESMKSPMDTIRDPFEIRKKIKKLQEKK
ncbi:hypothetical protein BCR32DRAFT_324260 [Anaeromyces robustus]|uniref:Alpha/beta-hydrolase n=1 Tax=Anaeromyces robustus TaxID=1754192 RepID=A0A1Y1XQ99_9FUNG|nr:hypothetical protein BCR32DRAFT_324260 [Anaeromyces robustus]|eukprot:ORX87922.1 hypothetical protein BCR32DRAFT_324260 [Anaeromyces robustus]